MEISIQRIIFSCGIMALICLALIGNVLVCLAVYYSRKLRARVNYIIVSLAFSDILVATTAMPIWMLFEITDFRNLSHESTVKIHHAWNFLDILAGIASIANLAAISFERLWSVCSPLQHRRYLTTYIAAGIISSVWLYALFVAIMTVSYCEEKWTVLFSAMMGFIIPMVLIFIAYSVIGIVVNTKQRNVISSQDNMRINSTIIVIILIFFLCWAPYFITSILIAYCESCFFVIIDNLWIRSVLKFLHYSNSCINPLVYGIANAQYKDAFKAVFQKFCLGCLLQRRETKKSPTQSRRMLFSCQRTTSDAQRLSINTPEAYGIQENAHLISKSPEPEPYLPGDYRAVPYAQPVVVDDKGKSFDQTFNADEGSCLTRTSYI